MVVVSGQVEKVPVEFEWLCLSVQKWIIISGKCSLQFLSLIHHQCLSIVSASLILIVVLFLSIDMS
jgi:hypothetical protein